MKTHLINKLNAKIAIGIAAAGAIISIAFVRSPEKEKTSFITKKKVEAPFKNVNVDYTFYRVSAEKRSRLEYKTGSVIIIPENAFTDKNGKPLAGDVDIKYREFHDPADFFLSGIPMTYDSAGTEYHFESAGMLEILAYQNGAPVFINPGKKIVVEMASKQQEEKYNIYQFDSLAGNWKFIYKDRASGKLSGGPVEMAFTKPALKMPVTAKLLKEEELLKPAPADKSNYQFNLDVDQGEFPEIAVYRDVQFEVKANAPDFKTSYASLTWNDVSLVKGNNAGSYLMTLVKGTETHTFEVQPVFAGAAYDNAYSQYMAILENRKEKEAAAKHKSDSVYAVFENERKFQNEYAKDMLNAEAASRETQSVVQRVFVISGFGIWNSDCPAKLPQGEQFAANYTDSTGKKLQFKTLYLVEKGRNAMFAITSYSRLYYDPSKKNILWAVTSDNKLAVFEESRFKDLKKKNDSCTVEMKVIAKEITKAYEVREALNL